MARTHFVMMLIGLFQLTTSPALAVDKRRCPDQIRVQGEYPHFEDEVSTSGLYGESEVAIEEFAAYRYLGTTNGVYDETFELVEKNIRGECHYASLWDPNSALKLTGSVTLNLEHDSMSVRANITSYGRRGITADSNRIFSSHGNWGRLNRVAVGYFGDLRFVVP